MESIEALTLYIYLPKRVAIGVFLFNPGVEGK
jgi:hypothetical protein